LYRKENKRARLKQKKHRKKEANMRQKN